MSVDLILRNGRFTTLDRSNPAAGAVAIANRLFALQPEKGDFSF
jgi:predicted amidohydrolase YtcJ